MSFGIKVGRVQYYLYITLKVRVREDTMLIKRTRMIVITKSRIIRAICILLLMICSVTMCVIMVSGKSIGNFSAYKSIINNEFLPAKGKSKKVFTSKNSEEKILGSFFVLEEKKPKIVPLKNENIDLGEQISETVLRSESLKIDKGLKVSNATGYNANPQDYLNKSLAFEVNSSGPQVLIMHTHTTESFAEETYVKGAPDRNLDETKNMIAVGNAMAEIFEANGIKVIHDKTVHDYPSYNSAYQSAAATINKNLQQYKSIKVVLDVHRDGITREDGTKVKLVTDLNGEATAQIMLVVGTDVNLEHKNWQENFKFASKIQAKAIEMYPSLMRPIDLRKERFNEQLTLGSLIVEVGSNGNTMEEAKRGGRKIAEVISKVLKEG